MGLFGPVRRRRADTAADRTDFDAIGFEPRPRQDPLEVWLGGNGPKGIELAARLADGWEGELDYLSEHVLVVQT